MSDPQLVETTHRIPQLPLWELPEGISLHPVWGVGSMPESYLKQVDGFIIGKDSLACGLAVPSGRPVLTRDVFEEPLWKPWLSLAEQYGFRGCWSFPMLRAAEDLRRVFKCYRSCVC